MENNRDEVFSRRVRAGKRTYFVDVRSTRSGHDYYLTITESKRSAEGEEKEAEGKLEELGRTAAQRSVCRQGAR
ncbi:MAG: DUF3276 family protein [Chlorobi bacterium CHB2]|nr:DUF3276 family protein [Chlorobi bacterium CHB2]